MIQAPQSMLKASMAFKLEYAVPSGLPEPARLELTYG